MAHEWLKCRQGAFGQKIPAKQQNRTGKPADETKDALRRGSSDRKLNAKLAGDQGGARNQGSLHTVKTGLAQRRRNPSSAKEQD